MTKVGTPFTPRRRPRASSSATSVLPSLPESSASTRMRSRSAPLRDVSHHGVIADIAAFHEISPEQRFDEGILPAFLAREPDEPVAIECVRRPAHQIVAEFQPGGSAGFGDARIEPGRMVQRAEFPHPVEAALDTLLRHVRIELERPPCLRHGDLAVEQRYGPLEMVLADPAPGADRVGDDFDRDCGAAIRCHG